MDNLNKVLLQIYNKNDERELKKLLDDNNIKMNIIRKENENIIIKDTLDLDKNGDYYVIHNADLYEIDNRNSKLSQLKTWINITFKHGTPPDGNDIINTVADIYNILKTNNKLHQLNKLVEWLENGK